jgi:hypothetical protein
VIAGILLGIVAGLLANELCEFSPWCARKLVRWSAFRRYTDSDRAEMRAEELATVIDDRPGNLFKLITAVSFAVGAVIVSCRRAVARKSDRALATKEAVGKHRRLANMLLQGLAAAAPWLEAAGFLVFIAYYLNLPLLDPRGDWLGWSTAATVVAVIILGQTWMVRHAARSHNHIRQALANSHRHEAYLGITQRNRYIGLAAVIAAAVTSGMIWRGVVALGNNASTGTAAVLVFGAAAIGLLLPTLTYLGIALGSSDGLPRARRPSC